MSNKKKTKTAKKAKVQNKIYTDKSPDLQESTATKETTLPTGSYNTKIIISKGEIIERIYKTPKGKVVSLFPNPILHQAA